MGFTEASVALKTSLDSLEGLEPTVAGLYQREADGKYYLPVEGLTEIKSALNRANREAAERRKALEAFEGFDPEEYKRLREQADQTARAEAEKKGQYDALLKQHQDKFTEKETKWASREKALLASLEQNLVDAQASAALSMEKGIVELLLPHVKRFVRVVEEEGTFVAKVVDAHGNPRINDKHEPMTIHQLVMEMKANPTYGRAFEGQGASGGGATPQLSAGMARTPAIDPKLPASERLRMARANMAPRA